MKGRDVLNLPNRVTLFRFLLSLVLIPMLYSGSRFWSVSSGIVFLAASVSDFFDGYIAREGNSETTIGRIMDPVADKALVAISMVMLVRLGRLPAWIASLVLFREFFVSGLRISASKSGGDIEVSFWGKLKTFLQMSSLLLLILHYPMWGLNVHKIGMILLYIALIVTLYSGYLYTAAFLKTVSS